MKKIAIFVEGQTEQIFVERLIHEMAGDRGIGIEKRQGFGGRDNGRYFVTMNTVCKDKKRNYFILLVDSSNDGRVISDIREQFDSLQEKGFNTILGLRDVYPKRHEDLKNLRKITRRVLPTGQIPIRIAFAILEVETWFIAEHSHFRRLHPKLTPKFILRKTGINILDPNLEAKLCPENNPLGLSPAGQLNQIYKLVGKGYSKKKEQVNKIVNNLNFHKLFERTSNNIRSLHYFIHQLDIFFDT